MQHKWILLFFLLVAIGPKSSIAWSAENDQRQGQILKFQYHTVQNQLNQEFKSGNENAITYYHHALNAGIRMMVEDDPKFEDRYEEILDESLDVLEDAPGLLAEVHAAELRFLRAYSAFKNASYFTAAYQLVKVASAVEEFKENADSYKPAFPVRIAMEVMMSSLSEDMQSYLSWIGMEGSKREAKRLLSELQSHRYGANESYLKFYTVFLEDFMQYQYKDLRKEKSNFGKEFENHPAILFQKAMLYGMNHKNQEALKKIRALRAFSFELEPHYLNYLEGRCKMQALDSKAEIYLKKYLQTYPGKKFKKAAHLYLLWHAVLYKDAQAQGEQRRAIANVGDTETGPDALAMRLRNSKMHPELVRSRLLFDGGDFAEAEKVLRSLDQNEFDAALHKIEWAYRLGRIGQETQDYHLSIMYFRQAIDFERVEGDYMQANACLQLGEVYFSTGEKDKARAYFERCLEYEDYPYESSIRRSAKKSLELLDQ